MKKLICLTALLVAPLVTQARNVSWEEMTNYVAQFQNTNLPTMANAVTATNLAREYNLKNYGAFGDAKFASGALFLTNTATMTVTYGKFVPSDVGSYIGVFGAETNRRTMWTTILFVNSGNQIVLADTPKMAYDCPLANGVQTFTEGAYVVYGKHDDSAAISTWLNQYTNGGGKFYAPPGVYLILNAPQNTNQNNAQIIVPNWSRFQNSTNLWRNADPILHIYGEEAYAPGFDSTAGLFTPPQNSTWFVSNLQGNNFTGTNLFGASVFDFRDYDFPIGHFAGHNNLYYWPSSLIHPVFENVNILLGYDANAVALNLIAAYETEANRLNIIGGGFYPSCCPPPLGTNGWGLVMPGNYNGVGGDLRNTIITEFMNGLDMGIVKGDYITFVACSNALTSQFSGGSGEARLNAVQFSDCPIWYIASGLNFDGAAGSPAAGTRPIVDVLAYQSSILPGAVPDWQTNIFAYYDPSNTCFGGSITYRYTTSSGGIPQVLTGAGGYGGGVKFWVNELSQGTHSTNIWNAPTWFNNPDGIFAGVAYTVKNMPSVVSNSPVFNAYPYTGQGLYLQNDGDSAYISYGTRSREFWRVGSSDARTDPFPVADFYIRSVNPLVGENPFDALLITTNGSTYLHSNLSIGAAVQLPSQGWNLNALTNGLLPGAVIQANSNGVAIWTGIMGSGSITWLQHLP